MNHRDKHPVDVPGCFGCKLLSLQINASSAGVVSMTESRWDKDMPAYKRLRQNGLQPRSIDGCAELETRATSKLEVEMSHVFESKEDLQKAKEGMAMAREMGLGDG